MVRDTSVSTSSSGPRKHWRTAPGARLRLLVVVAVALVLSVCFISIKAGLSYAPPLLFGGLRALIAGIALLALAGILRIPLLPRRRWSGILVLALAATTLTYGGMFLSVGRTGAGIAAVLGNLQPLMAVLLAAAVLHEPMDRPKLVAVLLGAVGVLLIAYRGLISSSGAIGIGDVMALSASLGAALGSVIVKRMDLEADLLPVTGWQFVLGSLPLLVAAAAMEPVRTVVWAVAFIALLLFLSLVGTALATAVWFWLLGYEDVGRLSLFLFLVPALGLGLAALVLGEQITALEAAGALLILAAMVVVARRPSTARGPQQQSSAGLNGPA